MSVRKSKFRFVNHFFDYLEQIELFFWIWSEKCDGVRWHSRLFGPEIIIE